MLRRFAACICGASNSMFRAQLKSESLTLPFDLEQRLVTLCGGTKHMTEGDFCIHFINVKTPYAKDWLELRDEHFPAPDTYDPPLDPGVAKRLKNIILRLDDCHKLTWDAVQDANDRACNRQMSLNEQASNELLLFEVQGGVLGHLEETATSSAATAKDIAGVATVQKDLA